MLITPHALLGAAILKRVNLFVLGIPMAIASHFFLDAIPGWDVGLTSVKNIIIIITDGIIALILLAILSRRENLRGNILIWKGGFFGLLPDILSQGSNILGIHGWNPLESLHQDIQKSASIYWSLPAQVILSGFLVSWVFYRSKGSINTKKRI
jgi:hypothetical protein